MAYTLSQLQALEEAIAQGAVVVQYKDKRVEYRSLTEMRSLRAEMRRELGLTEVEAGRILPSFSRVGD